MRTVTNSGASCGVRPFAAPDGSRYLGVDIQSGEPVVYSSPAPNPILFYRNRHRVTSDEGSGSANSHWTFDPVLGCTEHYTQSDPYTSGYHMKRTLSEPYTLAQDEADMDARLEAMEWVGWYDEPQSATIRYGRKSAVEYKFFLGYVATGYLKIWVARERRVYLNPSPVTLTNWEEVEVKEYVIESAYHCEKISPQQPIPIVPEDAQNGWGYPGDVPDFADLLPWENIDPLLEPPVLDSPTEYERQERLRIKKYACIPGYEPDISDEDNPQPNGFPDPSWEAAPP